MQEAQTYSNRSNARRAASKAGLHQGNYTLIEADGRWSWEVTPTQRPTMTLNDMYGLTAKPLPVNAHVTHVIDGKKVAETEQNPSLINGTVVTRTTEVRSGYKVEKNREEQNGVARPSIGTRCRAVWDYLDANPAIKIAELLLVADACGWNRTNASCEFYGWRKFNGIKGRQS